MKKANTLKGVILATAAAGVFLAAGCASQGQTGASASAGDVKCSSVNACKGQGACKSTTNNCKGQSSCKGKGFVMMSSDADCKAAYKKMWNG